MRGILFLFIVLVFMVAGCASQQNTSSQKEDGTDNPENVTEKVEDSENDSDTVPASSEDSDSEEQTESTPESVEVEKEILEPTHKLNEKSFIVEPIDEAGNKKVVLLTIDDAPDEYAVEMATKLKELNVNAIFFVNGHFLDTEEEEEMLRQIHEMGFLIGNHTWNHPKLPELSEEAQREEIVSLNDKIEEIIGERPKFFRAPHGLNTDFTKSLAHEEGMLVMNWSFGYDYFKEYMTKDALTDQMVNTHLLQNGSNILMHDRKWTYEALEGIVKGYQEKGFTILDPRLIKTP